MKTHKKSGFFGPVLVLALMIAWDRVVVASYPVHESVESTATPVAASHCAPLPPPTGNIVNVSTVTQLENAVTAAISGTTILVADGIYNLDGVYLRFAAPNVTLRSASGNPKVVILDGNYLTTEIIQIVASNVTIADLTLREAYYHPIHVMSTDGGDTNNTLIYNVHIFDPGQQAIKINPYTPDNPLHFTDNGVVACSRIQLTDTGRAEVWNINGSCYTGGIDAHQSRGWVIRDNLIQGFWCSSDLSEHGIHFWRGGRDTVIERNLLHNNARGIGLGLVMTGPGRTYPDNSCPSAIGYVDDYGGIIRNNFISASDAGLFASEYGFDCGICLWNSCNARALHNTVCTADPAHTFSSIEWRFSNTRADIINNLVNDTMRERDGAIATQPGNLTNAQTSWFVNAASGDLHLVPTTTSAIDQVTAPSSVADDYDGDLRPIGSSSDVGADEYGAPPPAAVRDLHVAHAVTSASMLTATLRWTASAGAVTITLRYSGTLVTEANWNSATLLTNMLPGSAAIYTATLPYTSGTVYFALKSQNAQGDWSALSNNAFWPHQDVLLPLVLHAN